MGIQPGCSLEGMKAEAGEFLRGHIRAEHLALGSLSKQFRLASGLLLVHLQPVTRMAEMASESVLGPGDMTGMRLQLVADAGAAVFALVVAAVLSVYKPRGVTRYGQARTERHQGTARPS